MDDITNIKSKGTVNRDSGWISPVPDVENELEDLKSKVMRDLGIDRQIEQVKGDTGLLSSNTFGTLGGSMTSRMIEYGKQQYLKEQYPDNELR